MKKGDIIVLSVCVVIIVGAILFIAKDYIKKPAKPVNTSQETMEFTGEIDNSQVEKLRARKDYGVAPMDNIGREDPFAKF